MTIYLINIDAVYSNTWSSLYLKIVKNDLTNIN